MLAYTTGRNRIYLKLGEIARPDFLANSNQVLWFGAAKRGATCSCTGRRAQASEPALTASTSSVATNRRAECAQPVLFFFIVIL